MNSIELKELSKQFGSRTAVDKLTLSVEQGTVFGLLGQNGAGKTTTIKMLCGLLAPSSGNALIEGISVTDKPQEVKKLVAVSPQ